MGRKGLAVIHVDGLSHARIVFGDYDGRLQVNFEDQVGGHGSIGGDQLHPFVLAKSDWAFDTWNVTNTSELHPLLVQVRDRA